nr:phosphoglycerate mutase [Candidatus Sigynarchaeota archaeon]
MEQKNAILIVLDGLGDLPIPELGNKTPLQAATKPNLDAIASKGACGIMDITGSGEAVESDVAHLILFGYDPVAEYPGRGLLEALGVGMELSNGDIAFRGNLACLDANNIILDRRAGRNIPEAEEFVKAVNGISLDAYPGVRMDVVHSTEQRLAVVIRGPGLSASISMVNEGRTGVPASECNPVGSSPAAINTAKIIN